MSLRVGFGLEPLRQHDFFKHAIGIMTLIHDAKIITLLPNETRSGFIIAPSLLALTCINAVPRKRVMFSNAPGSGWSMQNETIHAVGTRGGWHWTWRDLRCFGSANKRKHTRRNRSRT